MFHLIPAVLTDKHPHKSDFFWDLDQSYLWRRYILYKDRLVYDTKYLSNPRLVYLSGTLFQWILFPFLTWKGIKFKRLLYLLITCKMWSGRLNQQLRFSLPVVIVAEVWKIKEVKEVMFVGSDHFVFHGLLICCQSIMIDSSIKCNCLSGFEVQSYWKANKKQFLQHFWWKGGGRDQGLSLSWLELGFKAQKITTDCGIK